jgi:hypothetical protein
VNEERLLYHQVMERDSKVFMEHMLDTIPELEAVAIIPSYAIGNADVPFASVMGQSGPLRSPIEIVHMCQQLWRTLAFQLENGQACIRYLDDHMKLKADELQKLNEAVKQKQAELAALTSPREPNDQSSS